MLPIGKRQRTARCQSLPYLLFVFVGFVFAFVVVDDDVMTNMQARDSGQRVGRVSDPQVEALQAQPARIGFQRSLYTPYILAYIFDKDNV